MDPIHVSVLWMVKSQMSRVVPSHKNKTFLTVRKNILSFPQLEKISAGAGQPSTGHWQEGTGEGDEDV